MVRIKLIDTTAAARPVTQQRIDLLKNTPVIVITAAGGKLCLRCRHDLTSDAR